MSRSGYSDDCENVAMWRGAVASALRGRRGQAFLKEMLAAFDALPAPRLIENDLAREGEVCAIGAVGKARGIDMSRIDPEDHDTVACSFDIAHAMACEIMYMNDEFEWKKETPEERFSRMRKWVAAQIEPLMKQQQASDG